MILLYQVSLKPLHIQLYIYPQKVLEIQPENHDAFITPLSNLKVTKVACNQY